MDNTEIIELLRKTGCPENVIEHCRCVSELAGEIAKRIDSCSIETAVQGGLIHDIGRSVSHGITHAVEGVRIAREHGVAPALIAIIRNHIGAGITKEEAQELGLPPEDFFPLSVEEKVVAHADNLISGTKRRTMKKLLKKLEKRRIRAEIRERFTVLHKELSELAGIDLDLLSMEEGS